MLEVALDLNPLNSGVIKERFVIAKRKEENISHYTASIPDGGPKGIFNLNCTDSGPVTCVYVHIHTYGYISKGANSYVRTYVCSVYVHGMSQMQRHARMYRETNTQQHIFTAVRLLLNTHIVIFKADCSEIGIGNNFSLHCMRLDLGKAAQLVIC